MGGVIYPLIATPCLVLSVKNQRMTPSNLWKFCWLSWWNIRPFEHQIQYVDRFAVINNASFSSSVYTSVINVKEMYRIRYQHVIHTCTVYLFRRKSKNSRWITKAASRNSVPMTHIRIQRETASRGNDDFSETGVFYYRDQNTPQIYIRVMQYI